MLAKNRRHLPARAPFSPLCGRRTLGTPFALSPLREETENGEGDFDYLRSPDHGFLRVGVERGSDGRLAVRSMRARRSSRCPQCRGEIEPGDEIGRPDVRNREVGWHISRGARRSWG